MVDGLAEPRISKVTGGQLIGTLMIARGGGRSGELESGVWNNRSRIFACSSLRSGEKSPGSYLIFRRPLYLIHR